MVQIMVPCWVVFKGIHREETFLLQSKLGTWFGPFPLMSAGELPTRWVGEECQARRSTFCHLLLATGSRAFLCGF